MFLIIWSTVTTGAGLDCNEKLLLSLLTSRLLLAGAEDASFVVVFGKIETEVFSSSDNNLASSRVVDANEDDGVTLVFTTLVVDPVVGVDI